MAKMQHSTLAAVGGFFLGPLAVGLAAGLLTRSSSVPMAGNLSFKFAAAHLAGLAGAYWAADKYPEYHSLFRGAMWGEGVSAAFAAADASAMLQKQASAPAAGTVSLAHPSESSLEDLTRKVLQGGWLRA